MAPVVSLPPNLPSIGLIYNGLERVTSGPCVRAFKLVNSDACSHGPDPAPAGLDVKASVTPVVTPIVFPLPPPPRVQCDGDGVTGNRVQVLYVHAPDVTDRYATYLTSFRQWAADADKIYRNSAAETAGERHIRFVHDSNCVPSVLDVTLQNAAGDDTFGNTTTQLSNLGYNLANRKYMLFVDANVYCGIGNIRGDDSPGAGNLNNVGPSYGRTDSGCWGGSVPAHELMHNLGGVQLSAPHTSGGWHCIDEYDRMCYSDSPNYPAMVYLCSNAAHEQLFDCNHDDYYSTNPVGGSYLATHWNSANNQFLVAGPQSVWGYVWANSPASPSYTPSTTYQRNSTGALNTITRSGVGAYLVKFSNLGIYYGGTVNVTAYGSGSETCKVLSWGPVLADMNVGVRCFDAAGNPVDAMFTASFTRPVSSASFGYVWAYTGNGVLGGSYQFNSTGAANSITNPSVGSYIVSLPNLGGPGGAVKVTAYGGGNAHCKVGYWTWSGTTENVNVLCQTPAGAPVNSMFTMTFHRTMGLLGVSTGLGWKVGYAWSGLGAYSYNSSGGVNSISTSGVGAYQLTMPGLATSRGHVQVSAYGGGTARCKVSSWGTSGANEVANIRCFDAAGAPVNAPYVVDFVD
ncbi:MAG TPA: hypothetical protein VGF23_14985 [Gaiellaceae bacterium]